MPGRSVSQADGGLWSPSSQTALSACPDRKTYSTNRHGRDGLPTLPGVINRPCQKLPEKPPRQQIGERSGLDQRPSGLIGVRVIIC
jgi:hypothetical protein